MDQDNYGYHARQGEDQDPYQFGPGVFWSENAEDGGVGFMIEEERSLAPYFDGLPDLFSSPPRRFGGLSSFTYNEPNLSATDPPFHVLSQGFTVAGPSAHDIQQYFQQEIEREKDHEASSEHDHSSVSGVSASQIGATPNTESPQTVVAVDKPDPSLLPPAPAMLNLMADPNSVHARSSRNQTYESFQPPPGTLRIWNETNRSTDGFAELPKHWLHSFAPDSHVNIALMGNVNISIIELLTFFPNHSRWRDYSMRFYQAGWTGNKKMKVVRYTRDWPHTDENTRSRMDKYVDVKTGERVPVRDRTPYTDLSCATWRIDFGQKRDNVLTDYYVEDLACGVRRDRFPKGGNKGALTRAIKYVLDHPDDLICRTLKLSDLERFVQIMGFRQVSINPSSKHPDVAALLPWKDRSYQGPGL